MTAAAVAAALWAGTGVASAGAPAAPAAPAGDKPHAAAAIPAGVSRPTTTAVRPAGTSRALRDIAPPPARTSSVSSLSSVTVANTPTTLQTFEGISNVLSNTPAQASIAVGPNDVFETVRPDIQIFSPAGVPLTSPIPDDQLWAGFGGPCSSQITGDWNDVVYDQFAARWVYARPTHQDPSLGPVSVECVAVSVSSDPTGAYYLYSFPVSATQWSDYPQFGMGSNAYFVGANLYTDSSASTRSGDAVMALNRAQLLAGQTAQMTETILGAQYETVIPVTAEGTTAPPNATEYFLAGPMDGMTNGSNLQLWSQTVNWANPSGSPLTGPTTVAVTPYNLTICTTTPNCGVQPGTSVQLETWQDNIMWPIAYRNFGTYQSIVGSFDVAGGSSNAAMQWFELRNTGSGPQLYQQGVYNPDTNGRYEQSIAQDSAGDIGLAYTLSGSGTYPSLAYTGQLAGDPLGSLNVPEQVLWAGSGSQTGTVRWGDASSLVLGPDDCTMWYVNAYYPTTSLIGWHTRIGAFQLGGCVGGATRSPTFAGYEATVTGSSAVTTATFTLPALTCTAANQAVNTGAAVQTSVSVSAAAVRVGCSSGVARYTAVDALNGAGAPLALILRAGDQVKVTVAVGASSTTVTVKDLTTSASATATGVGATPTAVQVGQFGVTSGSTLLGVPNFGSVQFSGVTVNGQALGSTNPTAFQRYAGTRLQIATGALATPTSFATTYKSS